MVDHIFEQKGWWDNKKDEMKGYIEDWFN